MFSYDFKLAYYTLLPKYYYAYQYYFLKYVKMCIRDRLYVPQSLLQAPPENYILLLIWKEMQ